MDEVVKEFLVESYENLDRLDKDLVELAKSPSKETIRRIFRAVHTIKGSCGFLGFSKLESVTHVGENLLSLLRDEELRLSPAITDALLAMVEAVREMLAYIESAGNEREKEYSKLIEILQSLQTRNEQTEPAVELGANRQRDLSGITALASPVTAKFGEILLEDGKVRREELERALQQQTKGDQRRLGEILVQQGAVTPPEVFETLEVQSEARTGVWESAVRLEVELIDRLMNLVGELVACRNELMQYAGSRHDPNLTATSHHLSLVTAELQKAVVKTRMQPICTIWNRFPRIVRYLAASCGKQVRIETEGAGTELDRSIIEAIKDPLTHVVRNAVDHGIESPVTRIRAGKPPEGRLLLRAFLNGRCVNIEISDDGAGIDTDKVRDKAAQIGLISAEQAASMTERELVDLIFAPGLSTAEQVTNVSGRGVGMDVVKTNIQKIGGTVEVQSNVGQGTTFKIKIPLATAMNSHWP